MLIPQGSPGREAFLGPRAGLLTARVGGGEEKMQVPRHEVACMPEGTQL